MNYQAKLKKEICLGKLIWMQPPTSVGSAVFFTKKLLNGIEIGDREMIYLSARQFVHYASDGFSEAFLKSVRILIIGDLEGLSQKLKADLLKKLSLYKMLKLRFDINLVLVSPPYLDLSEAIREQFQPSVFQIFEEGDPIGINEKIHDMIEKASADTLKPIWRLSLPAADHLEMVFLKKGEDYLKRLIYRAITYSQNKQLEQKDLDYAHQYISSFEVSAKTI